MLCNINEEEYQPNEKKYGKLIKVSLDSVDKNLKDWAKATNNHPLQARLKCCASDAHAGDVRYHRNCYLNLRYKAQAAIKSSGHII